MDIIKEFLNAIPYDKPSEEALAKIIDKKRARDYVILKQFDAIMKKGKMQTVDIYYHLSEEFKVSYNTIRNVVANRKANQI